MKHTIIISLMLSFGLGSADADKFVTFDKSEKTALQLTPSASTITYGNDDWTGVKIDNLRWIEVPVNAEPGTHTLSSTLAKDNADFAPSTIFHILMVSISSIFVR